MAADETYEIPGRSKVQLYKPFGPEVYCAVIDLDGMYPVQGSYAKNSGREEYLILLEGTVSVRVAEDETLLTPGDSVRIPDRSRYSIRGSGKLVVLVKDLPGGITEITPI